MIAIAVDRPAKAGAFELFFVVIEIGFAQPCRKGIGIRQSVQQPCIRALVCGPGAVWRIAGNGIVKLAQEAARIGLGFRFGHALFLEISLIEKLAAAGEDFIEDFVKGPCTAAQIGNGETGDRPHPVRPDKGGVPHDGGAPVMADQNRLAAGVQFLNQMRQIGDHVFHGIGRNRLRFA